MKKTIEMVKVAEHANAITHGGIFHADEVMATVILAKVMEGLKVCRTFKVPEELSEDVVVYDIGYGELDHHQKGGNGARENEVPYAACGLVWKKFGMQVVAESVNPEKVWDILDRTLIQGIDATDNGVMPKNEYPAANMSISAIISGFNPNWDSNVNPDDAFVQAFEVAQQVFDNCLARAEGLVKADAIVEEAIGKSEGHIMILDQFVPWDAPIFTSENEKAAEIQFVVFPSNRGGYNWQCVPDALGSFGQRKPVPESWRGLRAEELQRETGVATASFCHPAGFIGGADTLADAIALAKLAIES